MDESFIAESSKRVIPLQQWLQQWPTRLVQEKTPDEVFKEEHQQAKADLDAAYEKFKSENTPDSFSEVDRCMQRLKAFAQPCEATKEARERDYQHNEWNRQESFLTGLLDIFGNEAVGAIVDKWRERAGNQHLSRTSHPDNMESQNETIDFRLSPVDKSTGTQESLRSESQSPTIEPIPTPPRTHSPGEPSTGDQQEEVEATGPTTRSKRRASSSAAPTPRPAKSTRQSLSGGPLTREKIMFDKVYQDGQAKIKFVIVQRHGHYYIVRCKKHKLFFGMNPLRGALSHLRDKEHPNDCSNYDRAIELLGAEVPDCTEALCEENNNAAKLYFDEIKEKKRRHKRAWEPYKDLKRDPQPGEMYMVWFDVSKGRRGKAGQKSSQKQPQEEILQLFAISVLPFFPQAGSDFGNLSVMTSNLARDIPKCYNVNRATRTCDWAEGYGPGGKHALKRIYPIKCFDGAAEHMVQWIPMDHFRKFNAQDRDLEHKNIVSNFIASRRHNTAAGLESEVQGNAEELDEGSLGDDDDDRPTALRYTHTRNGETYEVIYLDEDDEPKTIMENPENYPLQWNIPEPEVKLEPASQDALERVDEGMLPPDSHANMRGSADLMHQSDKPHQPYSNLNQLPPESSVPVPTVASQSSTGMPIQQVETRNGGSMWTLPERSGGWPPQTWRQSTAPSERSSDGQSHQTTDPPRQKHFIAAN
ncbi:hypothetical protein F53441_14395 [Fusarium austroafricanum]|uniref:Uncharacterized protein n=1 Tax=Fusarium austroafricanum TaxID=2364996 RepID=A0A8H4JGF2_9HYPO|nr:hypothetical protein F53441_14395 [Fusarium austroafricanum]